MWSTALLALALGQNAPNDALKGAWADLSAMPPAKRLVTRYLALYPWQQEVLLQRLDAVAFTQNSLSWRGGIVPLTVIPSAGLLRIDLEELGWDRASRIKQLARLEAQGVRFNFKTWQDRERFVDIWETAAEPFTYFRVTHVDAYGKVNQGWLDPVIEYDVRNWTRSRSAVLRADQFLARAWVEKADGGFYSELLMLPPKEEDLYKIFLSPSGLALLEALPQGRAGGAITKSDAVALHARELQMLRSLIGRDEAFIHRTFDFAVDDVDPKGQKNPQEQFAGKVKHDGREIIGTLPNGLHWYYLADAKGNQVNVVPQTIALDMRRDVDAKHPVNDRNVRNSYKCVSCHGPHDGLWPYRDEIRPAFVEPGIGLLAIAKDKERVAELKQEIEEYYSPDLPRRMERQQKSYAETVKSVNGLDSSDNADALVIAWDSYSSDLVTLEQAAREMGLPKARAAAQLSLAGRGEGANPLVILSSGRFPIRRATFEKLFSDAMNAGVYEFQRPQVVEPRVKLRKAG